MKIIKVKIRNKKTKAIMEVKDSIAGDFIGTGEFEYVKEDGKPEENTKDFNMNK